MIEKRHARNCTVEVLASAIRDRRGHNFESFKSVQHCRLSDKQYSGNFIATLRIVNVTKCF